MKSIHDRLTTAARLSTLAAVLLLTIGLASGCARRAANDWAQTAPAIEPTRGGGGGVGFNAWDAYIEPRSLDAMSPTGMASSR